jgi:hypothetical protein
MHLLERHFASPVKPPENTGEKPSAMSLYQVPHNAGLTTLTHGMPLCSVRH